MLYFLPRLQFLFTFFLVLHTFFYSKAQTRTENIAAGSYAINLGIEPQTPANALKPYGLVYDLLRNYPVEVKWIIKPGKQKDEADFSTTSKSYKSSSFVIPVSYLDEEVKQIISKWENAGISGEFLADDMSLPVFTNLSVAPKWTLDKQNGKIAVAYFKLAGIPGAAHGGYSINNWKNPDELDICDDIFVMPHAEPKFKTHKNLYFWNRKFKGAIWAGCHAGSEMENLYGYADDEKREKLIQLNFLSEGAAGARTTGLIPFYEHKFATPPFTHNLTSDPVSQYLGASDDAYLNGSERILYPKKANVWRKTSKMIITDETTPDIPLVSHGPGAVLVYGPGFGDEKNGSVMYQASHDLLGNKPANIAAIRAFLNWSFYATEIKRRENIIQFRNLLGDKIFAARVGDDLAKTLSLDPILFDLDKAEIKPSAAAQMDQIAAYMLEYPELLIDIRSYTDSRADDQYNLELSSRRVSVTKDYLISKGVAERRISGRGYGETELLNKCRNGVPCSESQHEQNRRSEFILSINCELFTGKLKF